MLGIADAGSGDTLEAARTLLHLPLHSQAFANLEDGTKRALGLMLQSLDAVSTTVSRMRSAADGIRAALDHVRAVPNPSGGGGGGSRTDSGATDLCAQTRDGRGSRTLELHFSNQNFE